MQVTPRKAFVAGWTHTKPFTPWDMEDLMRVVRQLEIGLDLLDVDMRKACEAEGIHMPCVLPSMKSLGVEKPFHAGFNNGLKTFRRRLFDQYKRTFDECRPQDGFGSHVIVFTGRRTTASIGDQQQRLVDGLAELAELADKAHVTLVLEALNGKYGGMRGHPEILGRDTKFCLDVVDEVNHGRLQLAYDVYHSVVMGENPAELIEEHAQYLGYFHIAGIMPTGEEVEQRGPLNRGRGWEDCIRAMDEFAPDVPRTIEYIPPTQTTDDDLTETLRHAANVCMGVGAGV